MKTKLEKASQLCIALALAPLINDCHKFQNMLHKVEGIFDQKKYQFEKQIVRNKMI